MHDAYENWGKHKKSSEEMLIAKQQEDLERVNRSNKRVRVEQSSKAFQEFNFDEFPFIEESNVADIFKEEFEFYEKLSNGVDIPPYSDLITRGAKSRLWDMYAPMLKELIEFKEKSKKGDNNGIKGSDPFGVFNKNKNDIAADAFLGNP
jgi:hypothetical protein